MQLSVLPFLLLLVLAGRKAASLSKSVVTLYPPWFSVLKNDPVTLRCEGSGIPENSSTLWLHNDTIIPVQIQDYNIIANNVTYSGKYQCQRGQSALSDPVKLEVFPDWLVLQTLKLVYMKGEPMVLRCHSWENKHMSKVTFYQNGKGRMFLQRDSNFSISRVNNDDSGDYSCAAKIGNRQEMSRVVRIIVQDPSLPSSPSKIWYYILFYLVMGILFAVDTGLYFTVKREVNGSKKDTRYLLTRWHKEPEDD
ncbi:low affinity immunoglobulin gamma Fc region receptor III-like [Trichosurus vulpecula]|uniref:low affinity immunoglobulin gamma Fc region receptor III-like n=1 Tax=Trichosurus vulpecula TaxID=9337 RepID=UPI00186B1945|nr:low affinity immunoglobulin gamma Fc region receptor III-like [Trichosurus vulpecula]